MYLEKLLSLQCFYKASCPCTNCPYISRSDSGSNPWKTSGTNSLARSSVLPEQVQHWLLPWQGCKAPRFVRAAPPASVSITNSCAGTTHKSRARFLHRSLLLRQLSPVPPTGRSCLWQQKIPY